MPIPYEPAMIPLMEGQMKMYTEALGKDFADVALRLRRAAEIVERASQRAFAAKVEHGDLLSADPYERAADNVLHELTWLMPNMPVSQINKDVRRLATMGAFLQQLGELVTDEDRVKLAAAIRAKEIVAKMQRLVEAGRVVHGGRKITGVTFMHTAPALIVYNVAGRKNPITATPDDVEFMATLQEAAR